MSKIKVFIASVPLATGVTEYDSEELLKELPGDLKPIDRQPFISVNSDEIFFIWRCQKKTLNTRILQFECTEVNELRIIGETY